MKAALTAVALACTLVATAHAGRACEAKAPQATSVQRAMELAVRTREALDASGAQVVVLARAGQDLDKYGLRWSHLGYAYKTTAGWRVVHKLNQCGTAQSALYRQGLGEFFLDDLFDYRAAYVVPTAATQQRLLALLADDAQAARLHVAAYNMVAYPWAQTYQQSNQWAIETLALAEDGAVRDRRQAQAWLQLRGYEPTALKLGAFTRLGARATAANIAFDDHPNEKRYADRIETVTVDSVFAWLQKSGLGSEPRTVR
jgi:hypothetical protein